jgi:hypothetical protein
LLPYFEISIFRCSRSPVLSPPSASQRNIQALSNEIWAKHFYLFSVWDKVENMDRWILILFIYVELSQSYQPKNLKVFLSLLGSSTFGCFRKEEMRNFSRFHIDLLALGSWVLTPNSSLDKHMFVTFWDFKTSEDAGRIQTSVCSCNREQLRMIIHVFLSFFGVTENWNCCLGHGKDITFYASLMTCHEHKSDNCFKAPWHKTKFT